MDPGKEVEELEVLTCLSPVVHATAVQEVVSVNILPSLGVIQRKFILVIH